jgi:hypothetical protein
MIIKIIQTIDLLKLNKRICYTGCDEPCPKTIRLVEVSQERNPCPAGTVPEKGLSPVIPDGMPLRSVSRIWSLSIRDTFFTSF